MNRHRYIVRAGRHVSKVPILLQKSFWGDERNFLEPLIRFTSGDVRGPYHLIQNRPGTSIVALKSDTAPEKSKDQLSRDFSGRSIFDFCNNICQKQTSPGPHKKRLTGPRKSASYRPDACWWRSTLVDTAPRA